MTTLKQVLFVTMLIIASVMLGAVLFVATELVTMMEMAP
jgi:hypothetical protein